MGCGASKTASAGGAAAPAKGGDYPPTALAPTLKGLPEWITVGCGNEEYYCPEKGATFPGDNCPDELPDLSEHNNLCANALREHPEIYQKYKNVKTPGGVSLAKCIKTGIDNKGHPHIMTCGLVAGDEDSYTTFKDLFDIVVGKRNGDYAPDAKHETDMDISHLSTTKIDPDGKYVLTTRCRTGRSVRGLPLPPACSFEQRRETERVVVKGLNKLTGELKGKYFPLCGSRSMAGAMDHKKEEKLRSNGNLFQEPDSTLLLSSGCGRHWPDARGIFHNDAENFFVWVNEEDQMRIVSMEKGDNIRAIFNRFANATKAVQESLEKDGYGIMHNDHLGYILTCPSNLGTGLRAGAMVKVPKFSARKDFKDILKKMRMQARGTAGVDSASTGGIWDISNSDRLGMSEIQLCNLFIEGVAQVIRWEKALEKGEDIEGEVAAAHPMGLDGVFYGASHPEPAAAAAAPAASAEADYPPHALAPSLKDLPEWIKVGCGNAEYICEEKGATFPGDNCPDELPDLSEHNNLCANALREHPEIYQKYKNVKTPGGVSLAKCIKTGIDNKGHPHIMTCGLVAGDEDSYTTFKDLFDIVVGKRNGDYAPDAVHTTDMDASKLSQTKIDPEGKYVLTTRCRTGRSVRGLPLPPACSFEQRRETERVVVNGLNKLTGELKGAYFPLCGSRSMPGAMDHAKEEKLRSNGNLFQEPDSTLLLSSGCGRHWPDARGIFHNDAENFFVWVNEEDQMRIVSMEKGDNIHAIFNRFCNATKAVQESLESEGYGIMHNDHLGYILTCPSNLGTGLRAGAMVTVPLFSARPDFKDILKKMRLQARGTAGVDSASSGGTWDISNSDRLGMSEVQLCNLFIEGVAQIIRWEQALEKGEDIEAEVAEAKPLGI